MSSIEHFAIDSSYGRMLNSISLDDSNPYTLPIIYRHDKSLNVTEQDLIQAVAIHMFRIMDSEHFEPNSGSPSSWAISSWALNWIIWRKQNYRKVFRRAKPAAFDAFAEKYAEDAILTHVADTNLSYFNSRAYGIQLLSLPPMIEENTPRDLKKFQVSGFQLPSEPVITGLSADNNTLVMYPNRDAGMSTGKLLAQAAHAAQLSYEAMTMQQLFDWKTGDCKIHVIEHYPENVYNPLAEVEDAGLTEIPAGTKTFKTLYVP